MLVYLSKKIAIPNNTRIRSISWNRSEGYVAIGGDDGLLKVLKLGAGGESEQYGLAPSSNLSMNLTLEGHSEPVQVVVWNEKHQKLTTSDTNGVIIVWMFYKGSWYEEMINNRNKSTVRGMAWSADGQKICIVYEDGAVILGGVDGNRIWGKELKSLTLTGVQWSPDGSLLLFSVSNGELHLYDNQGNFVKQLRDFRIDKKCQVTGLDWYNGSYGLIGENCPRLLICYNFGYIQLWKNEDDEKPVIVETEKSILFAAWNHNGSMFAVGCEISYSHEESNCIIFYSAFGTQLRILKLPGRSMTGCAWEGSGLRLAIAVDSYIFFANVRPDYQWCFYKRTVVFSSGRCTRAGVPVMFWDTHSNVLNVQHVAKLYSLAASGNYCVLGVEAVSQKVLKPPSKYALFLCDTGGTIICGKYLDVEPLYVTMNSNLIVLGTSTKFCLWQYSLQRLDFSKTLVFFEAPHIYDIADVPTGEEALLKIPNSVRSQVSVDEITCMTCSESLLLIGKRSCWLNQYDLPHVALTNYYKITGVPQCIKINCNNTKAVVIDSMGGLSVITLRSDPGLMRGEDKESATNKLIRKDAWNACWAADNPHMLAVMEKARLYIFRGVNPEEPIASSAHICSFEDLEINSVLLDDAIENPDRLHTDLILNIEVKSLRDTRQLLNKVGLKEANQFVEDNPHPRLWRLLAESALKQLDLVTAEAAYVRCQNLCGIQFTKKINIIQNQNIRKAEIAAFFKDFDDAEKYYIEANRRDLAIALRIKLGDWFKVLTATQSMRRDNIQQLYDAYNGVGHYYAVRHNWSKAKEFFLKSQKLDMLAHCYFHLEDYVSLEKLIADIDSKDPVLEEIANWLASVGLCESASQAYAKCGKAKKGVALCVKLNEWEMALDLAKKYSLPEMKTVLSEYTDKLVETHCVPQAINLYRKTYKFLEAATIAFENAVDVSSTEKKITMIKKWYVFGAIMLAKQKEENGQFKHYHHEWYFSEAHLEKNVKGETYIKRMTELTKKGWRYAVAYNLYGLSQRQLHANNIRRAFVTALKLREYEDIIPPEAIYSLIALVSCACRAFGMCSRAFERLEAIENLASRPVKSYGELAAKIFREYPSDDLEQVQKECVSCETMIPDWSNTCPSCNVHFPTCMITGQSIMDPKRIWTCSHCQQISDSFYMQHRNYCALCHGPKLG